MRDKKKVMFLILTDSGGVRGHKKGHKKALSDISYEGPIRYLHQTLHIGVKITNMTNNVQYFSAPLQDKLSGKAFLKVEGFQCSGFQINTNLYTVL